MRGQIQLSWVQKMGGRENSVALQVRRNGPEVCWEFAVGFGFVVGAWALFAARAVAMFRGVRRRWRTIGTGYIAAPGPVFIGAKGGVGRDGRGELDFGLNRR